MLYLYLSFYPYKCQNTDDRSRHFGFRSHDTEVKVDGGANSPIFVRFKVKRQITASLLPCPYFIILLQPQIFKKSRIFLIQTNHLSILYLYPLLLFRVTWVPSAQIQQSWDRLQSITVKLWGLKVPINI